MDFILIGFEYFGNKKLPGILVDLYLAYNFIKSFHKNPSITIISDINRDVIRFIFVYLSNSRGRNDI